MASFDFIAIDARPFDRVGDALAELSEKAQHKVTVRVLRRIGDMTKTRVVRLLAEETGLPQKRIRSVMQVRIGGTNEPRYEIKFRDQFLSLKEFDPVWDLTKNEGRGVGVRARPWGKRRVFPRTFLGPGMHVFVRFGKERQPIKKLWGPAIPRQVIIGQTKPIVQDLARTHLVPRYLHEINYELGRVKKKHGL